MEVKSTSCPIETLLSMVTQRLNFFATAMGNVADLSIVAPLARAINLEYENFRNGGILTNNPTRKCIHPLFRTRCSYTVPIIFEMNLFS